MTLVKRRRFPRFATPSMIFIISAALLSPLSGPANANAAERLDVTLDGLSSAGALPDESAYCSPTGYGPNASPGISWSPGPEGTRSYALLMVDPDVPADLSAVNQPDVVIPEDAPRQSFIHWVLIDMPPSATGLPAGTDSRGVTPKGKPFGAVAHGVRGVNDYARFFNGNPDTAGPYGGYDGPCPPGNDGRLHRYVFRVYALDVPSLGLSGPFDGRAVEQAVAGHVLAQGEAVGTYTLNPAMR
ncbi:MAG TPA: YbhB/YbcL family Raf kinase inhibitor-like protein [Arenibaculum sp.]|nr:YbhB/YbcL family Raf kinase inhibitor-like protein [Arenibaculum sp.]